MSAKPRPPANRLDIRRLTPERQVMLASGFSVAVAGILVAVKAMTLAASGSVSILASLADSGLDLLASLITFFAVRYAKTPPDKEHPFGHGKAEAFSALFQAGLVFASAAIVMQECLRHILHPQPVRQSGLALSVLFVSILLTLALVAFQNRVLKSSQSVAISADRMHYLADLITNLIAVAGIGAAMLGFPFMDAAAGFLMAAWLIRGAIQVLREAADHLMDRALDDDSLARILALVLEDRNIRAAHQLRTRLAGPYILIQMHVELDPALSLVAAHAIIVAAEKRLLAAFPNADILIHPDPQGQAEPHGGVFHEAADDAPADAPAPFDSRRAHEA